MSMPEISWAEDPFFPAPEQESIDGGTTTAGPLWHATNPRWGHSMHTMCSYHGMFPAKVAHYFIQQFTRVGDLVVDPFSGRGTVPLQARVEGRRSVSNDLSPLAYILSKAKAAPPLWAEVQQFIDDLERSFRTSIDRSTMYVSDDIRMLYHPETLEQICSIRERLHESLIRDWNAVESLVAGALAGIMHGSHRRDGTSQYLSISMPNTFSMSPSYVAKYIREKALVAPAQNVFELLRNKVSRLYLDAVDGPDGSASNSDASLLLTDQRLAERSVDLLLTSPPYLQVVNYGTSNWIRLWLLGIEEVGRERGAGRRSLDAALDHRHTYSSYLGFMSRVLSGVDRVLAPNGVAAIVIGDVANPGKEAVPLAAKIWEDVGSATGLKLIQIVEDHLPVQSKVSRIWGETKGQATERDCVLLLTRPKAEIPDLTNPISWDEPYKDGGPDAAHERVRSILL
jgi:hypothetical protein